MFKDVFQTEHLIAKKTGIAVRTLGYYFFEPLMFGFKIRFFIIVTSYFFDSGRSVNMASVAIFR